jgi:hypothetical protein
VKVILSRKGFDTASGGCPSPIFPDGTMMALPIPDENSTVRYRDLTWNGRNLAALVSRMSAGKIPADHGAHLDPDIRTDALPRAPGWRPIFGQHGAARGHIQKQGVGEGDIFLFFGLFRDVREDDTFVPASRGRHIIWGWMQVGEILPVDQNRDRLAWASYHPHLTRGESRTNAVYIGADHLRLPGLAHASLPGAGIFPRFAPAFQLTAEGAAGSSTWRLPAWFHPKGRRSALSYHGDPQRWTREGETVLLRAVGRGQEFVIDGTDYPEVVPWIAQLLG